MIAWRLFLAACMASLFSSDVHAVSVAGFSLGEQYKTESKGFETKYGTAYKASGRGMFDGSTLVTDKASGELLSVILGKTYAHNSDSFRTGGPVVRDDFLSLLDALGKKYGKPAVNDTRGIKNRLLWDSVYLHIYASWKYQAVWFPDDKDSPGMVVLQFDHDYDKSSEYKANTQFNLMLVYHSQNMAKQILDEAKQSKAKKVGGAL